MPISNNVDDNLHESVLPCVPYVAFRCPNCGRHRPRTSNVRGRMRHHVCMACGMRYKSYELPATAVNDWSGQIPPDAP